METPFIATIYPPTRDATSNQHLADKEDEEGSNTWQYLAVLVSTWQIKRTRRRGAIALYNDTQI